MVGIFAVIVQLNVRRISVFERLERVDSGRSSTQFVHSILTDRNTSSNKTLAYSGTAIPFL